METDIISLRLPPEPIFFDLPKVCLLAIAQIHDITLSESERLLNELEATVTDLAVGSSELIFSYQVTGVSIHIVLTSSCGTRKLNTHIG